MSCRHYLVILAIADSQDKLSKWSGLVESKIRILIGQLESSEGIELAHIYPRSYPPPSEDFCESSQSVLMWFIGLVIRKNDKDRTVNVTITPEIQMFTNAGVRWLGWWSRKLYKVVVVVVLLCAVVTASSRNPEFTDGTQIDVRHVRK